MLEKAVQKKVVDYAKKLGFIAIKLSTNGRFGSAGWPDYMFIKNGKAFFLEFKATGGEATPLQSERAKQLSVARFPVAIVDDVRDGEFLVNNWAAIAEKA